MFNSDNPILNPKEDLLGRTQFASALSKAVLSFKQKDSLTIGLFGKWGSGKTSIINLFEHQLHQYNYDSFDEQPIFIRFNPWNFSDQNQLIEQFFLALSNGLDIDNIKDTLNHLSKGLDKVGQITDIAKYIPILAPVAQIVSPLIHDYAKALKTSDKGNDLHKIRNKISKELYKIQTKLIVIIDDIDRLNNTEIRQMFQLVKSLADFPNTIYLLPFDKAVILDALKESQKGDGNEYLKKIIQIPIEIPNIDIVRVYKYMFAKLDQIIYDYPNYRFEPEYLFRIFGVCVKPFIDNLRDVNRLLNIFSFKYDLIKDEVNIADLLALTSLEVFLTEIYIWIKNNKEVITGSYGGMSMTEQNKNREKFEKEIKSITDFDVEKVIEILRTLFPAIDHNINSSFQMVDNNELIRTQRLAAKEKFDIYYLLSLENIKISRKEIDEMILNYSYEELNRIIEKYNSNEMIGELLIELQSHIKKVPLDRVPILIQVLFDSCEILVGHNVESVFRLSASRLCLFIVFDLFKRCSEESDRFKILKNIMLDTPNESVSTCAHVLHIIELAHGRLAASSSNHEDQIIDVTHLKEIEQIVVDKIASLSQNYNLLDQKEFQIIFYIWSCLDDTSSKNYIKMLLDKNINIVKFVAFNAKEWTSYNGQNTKSWEFNDEDINKYIEKELAIEKIYEVKHTKEFSSLDIWIKRKAIAFILWNLGRKDRLGSIYISEVDKELMLWEAKK